MTARRLPLWRVGSAFLGALVTSCTVGGGADLPDATTATGATTASAAPLVDAAANESDAAADPAEHDWREAARQMHWQRAYELIVALPEADKDKAEMRLALGRIALGAGHHAEAVAALEGLEARLPSVREEIRDWYAEAAAVAGPYDTAAKTLAASPRVRDLLSAALAWQRAGELGKARKLADKAVARAQRVRRARDEAEAHWVRGGIAEQAGQKAVAAGDFRWFVERKPRDARVRDAIAAIDRLGGVLPLGKRAAALAESSTADNLDSTLESIAELETKHPREAVTLAMARARAIYVVRDYGRAKTAYDAAAILPTGFAAEAAYHAARATARSGEEADALARYANIAARYPKNAWAERAAYRRAELLLSSGRYADAAQAFAGYLSRFGKTKWTEEARYGRALALLSSGKAKQAREQLTAMRRDAGERRYQANLRHLEGVAAYRAGQVARAKQLWLKLVREQPLTWPAMAAHARLAAIGHQPLPALIGEPRAAAFSALPIALPAAPALLHSLGLDAAAERRLALLEQTVGQSYPARESEALCEMYGLLAGAKRRQKVAVRAVALEVLMRPPSVAERWAWSCAYPHPFANIVRREQQRHDLPTGLIYSVMRQESAFATDALSPVGARGLMQLMPTTAARAAAEVAIEITPADVTRPDVNVRLGAFYLAKLLGNFGGHTALAVAAYNAGPHAAKRWLRSGEEREADLWVARIPYRETRNYVTRVMGNLARYQYLAGGSAAVTPLSLALPDEIDIGADAY